MANERHDSESAAFTKNQPVTEAESYLRQLCDHSFLSLWSWPSLFRDQRKEGKGDGKEVCDLLVVFDNTVLIFSDKLCRFPETGNLELDWKRWVKRAVFEAADQAWGAERWIKQYPDRLFLDKACTKRFPFKLPDSTKMEVHRIVVAHDVADRCARLYGGSGSLMFNSTLAGMSAHTTPFMIGDLDPTKGYVHVLDDTSLAILMRHRDTITDFVDYLRKKERLVRESPLVVAPGEEDLLACFLRSGDGYGDHEFPWPKEAPVALEEGLWDDFQRSKSHQALVQANTISYLWDHIIERSASHALAQTQYFAPDGGLPVSELIVRIMAKEPRHRRRHLVEAYRGLFLKSGNQREIRLVQPVNTEGTHYVFLTLAIPSDSKVPTEEYRKGRYRLLRSACIVTRLTHPEAKSIVGIATEPGLTNPERSEDLCYLDGTIWSPEAEKEAQRLQKDLNLLVKMNFAGSRPLLETPPPPQNVQKLPARFRNKPCPCGSSKKYKQCCGSF